MLLMAHEMLYCGQKWTPNDSESKDDSAKWEYESEDNLEGL